MKKLLTEKKKKTIVVLLVLWLILAIVLVVPASVAYVDSIDPLTNNVDFDSFKSIIGNYILNLEVRAKAFQNNYLENTKSFLGYYSFLFGGFILIVVLGGKDKSSYHDIEHGSSDWCEGGEQYKVLSKKSGLILAEKNYLPVNKPGNVNVLIVGRIWCW